jgi:prolyl-tRNA synthetase
VVLTPISCGKSESLRQVAEQLYSELKSGGVDVLLDDRDGRPGVMFAEMELIGIPHRVTIGERGLKAGEVEYVDRRTMQTTSIALTEIYSHLRRLLAPH